MSTLYLCGAGNPEGIRLAQIVNRAQARWDRIVVLDDDPAKHGRKILGVEVAGPFAALELARDGDQTANLVARTTVKRWAARCKIAAYELPPAKLIAPGIDTDGVELGEDVILYPHAILGPEVSLGDGCAVFMAAIVGHESRLGRGCVVAPGAVINARVELGDGVYVGCNAAILPEVKVGDWATIGAGSVAMRDVPAGATLMGVPGRVVLPAEVKFKMGEFKALPPEIRRQLQDQVGQAAPAIPVAAGA